MAKITNLQEKTTQNFKNIGLLGVWEEWGDTASARALTKYRHQHHSHYGSSFTIGAAPSAQTLAAFDGSRRVWEGHNAGRTRPPGSVTLRAAVARYRVAATLRRKKRGGKPRVDFVPERQIALWLLDARRRFCRSQDSWFLQRSRAWWSAAHARLALHASIFFFFCGR